MTAQYDKITVQGKTLDQLTFAAFRVAQGSLPDDNEWSISQGSYNAGGVGASGGTHDGGGAIDISAFNHKARVRALRETGFAAWFRPEIPGTWPDHIHAVLVGNLKLSPEAKAQVQNYINYDNGLASHLPDNTWHPFPKGGPPIVFRWAKYVAEQRRVDALKDALRKAGNDVERAINHAQNDVQKQNLREIRRDLEKMNAEFRFRPDLYVEVRGKG